MIVGPAMSRGAVNPLKLLGLFILFLIIASIVHIVLTSQIGKQAVKQLENYANQVDPRLGKLIGDLYNVTVGVTKYPYKLLNITLDVAKKYLTESNYTS